MELSNLTDRELNDLTKQIRREQEIRKMKNSLLYKSNLCDGELFEELLKITELYLLIKFNEERLAQDICPYDKMNKALYTLCDYTFGNYKIKEYKLMCNGSRLLIENKKDYKEMHDELCGVVKKWIEKEKDYISNKEGNGEHNKHQ